MNILDNFILILKEHWLYRKQIFKLAKADIVRTYRGSAIGWAWAIIKPTISLLVYWFGFQIGLKSGKDHNGYSFFLWLIAGMIPWFYISEMLSAGSLSIRKYYYLVTKTKYPVCTIPTFVSISNMIIHLILTLITMIIFIISGHSPDIYWLQLIFYIILSFTIWTVWGLFSSLLSAISLDFNNLIKALIPAVLWVSGIFWDSNTLKYKWLKIILNFNPVTYIVNGYRNCFINKVWFWEEPDKLAYFGITLLVMILLALWAYKKVRKDIPDVL